MLDYQPISLQIHVALNCQDGESLNIGSPVAQDDTMTADKACDFIKRTSDETCAKVQEFFKQREARQKTLAPVSNLP